jgi:hypothetical protein
MNSTYTLIVPIEMGTNNIIEVINLHKPTLGELTKVRSTDPYTRGLEMLVACADQPKIVLQKLSYDDTSELMENVLPDFLGMTDTE